MMVALIGCRAFLMEYRALLVDRMPGSCDVGMNAGMMALIEYRALELGSSACLLGYGSLLLEYRAL